MQASGMAGVSGHGWKHWDACPSRVSAGMLTLAAGSGSLSRLDLPIPKQRVQIKLLRFPSRPETVIPHRMWAQRVA